MRVCFECLINIINFGEEEEEEEEEEEGRGGWTTDFWKTAWEEKSKGERGK